MYRAYSVRLVNVSNSVNTEHVAGGFSTPRCVLVKSVRTRSIRAVPGGPSAGPGRAGS